VGLLAFFILYFIPEPIVKVFTADQELIQSSVYAIHRAFFLMYIIGGIMLGTTIFQSLGKAGQSLLTSLSRAFFFMLPCLFIMGHFWQLDGIWMSFPIVDALTAILVASFLIPQINELRRKSASEKIGNTLISGSIVEAEQK
jgi:Na+-driven multidrug efflux pump